MYPFDNTEEISNGVQDGTRDANRIIEAVRTNEPLETRAWTHIVEIYAEATTPRFRTPYTLAYAAAFDRTLAAAGYDTEELLGNDLESAYYDIENEDAENS